MVKYSPHSGQSTGGPAKVQAKPTTTTTPKQATRLSQAERDIKTNENKAAKFAEDVENKNKTGLGSTVAPELSTDNTIIYFPAVHPDIWSSILS